MRGFWMCVLLALGASLASAHDGTPAYLELSEIETGRYLVTVKRPKIALRMPPMRVVPPSNCRNPSETAATHLEGALVERYQLSCDGDLAGGRVTLEDLDRTNLGVVVRIAWADGVDNTFLVEPEEGGFQVPDRVTLQGVAWDYTILGLEHILLGVDHLLFVLCLLLIIKGAWLTLKTITAFTVAHSITLALVALDVVHVPAPPVEAVVALSIVFLAREKLALEQGRVSLSVRKPWLIAFGFGLIHGMGFATALEETGLPQRHVAMALLLFNVGVEIGQILFISAVACIGLALSRLPLAERKWPARVLPYAIGTCAAFWVVERMVWMLA